MFIRFLIREFKDWLEFLLGNIPGRTGFFLEISITIKDYLNFSK